MKDKSVWDIKEGYIEGLHGVGLEIQVDEEEVREVAKTAAPWMVKGLTGLDGGIREW